MKILIIGKNGQLGKSINKATSNTDKSSQFDFIGRQELDLSNIGDIDSFFNHNIYDIVINCAAYTNVDMAEKDYDLSNAINNLAVKKIARIAKIQSFKFIHISTDYVFSGHKDKPYTEEDITGPINAYGRSKLEAESAIMTTLENNAIIIRTSGLYSEFGNNFVNTMLTLVKQKKEISVVSDQIFCPTSASDLAEAILTIINTEKFESKTKKTEIYQYCSNNACSWFDFANEIFRLSNNSIKVNPIKLHNYPALANKPQYSVLNTSKIEKEFGLTVLDWKEALGRLFVIKDISN
tara:strand:- start:50 stop:931 length:882 start_codon:yes stop_codon:yes gene_type:complete